MSKKKSKKMKQVKTYASYVAVLFAIASICMMFLTTVKLTLNSVNSVTNLSGFKVIFGYSESSKILGIKATVVYSNFSILGLFALILPVLGGLFILCKNRMINYIAMIAFLAGAVISFLMVYAFTSALADAGKTLMDMSTASLGIGGILAGVFNILALLCGLVKVSK